jgi:sec-independent protein translocase protein TatA
VFDSKVLIVILVLAVIVFGTRRLRSIGSDLGGAVKGFHRALNEGEPSSTESPARDHPEDR